MFITILAFLLVIGILVMVHELGHFTAAKLLGVKVLEFAIGFPPRIFSKTYHSTKYSIGALLFGGYVRMLGEEEKSKDPAAFNNQRPRSRFIISIAGVFMNIVLAWVLITIGFSVGMTPIATPSSDLPGQQIKPQIFIADIMKNTAAEKAGLKVGDEIISATFEGATTTFAAADDVTIFSGSHLGKDIILQIKSDNTLVDEKVALSSDMLAPMGIAMIDQAIVRLPWYKAPGYAAREVYRTVVGTWDVLAGMFAKLFSTGKVSDQVGGPVAIFNLSGSAARGGFAVLISFIAMLSINLAIINILPFPALDGGRALFIIFERVLRKKVVKEEVENMIHAIGFILLILLILAITYKDIVKIFHN
ncbi:MAG: M50 family metallopeptidase [Candidatus Berkelbacteria bacterium]